jgi:putative ABC transport system permease protein
MNIAQCFQLAIRSIKAGKGRSFLTMLGIIIGVMAVIVIVGLGNGMEKYMKDSFKDMGTNLLTVNIMGRGSSRSVSEEYMYTLAAENSALFDGMSPSVSFSGNVKIGAETLSYTEVSGVSEDYNKMKALTLLNGRFLQYSDILNREKVCVIGSYIATEFFLDNALAKQIRINGAPYRVIGVLEESSDSSEMSGDNIVLIPYSTAARESSTGRIGSYIFSMISEGQVTEAREIIENALYDIFGSSYAYRVTSMQEVLDTMNSMIGVVVTVLAAIAAISLVVGGVGIMNIMLVSVSERTREIGIRKALGAKRRHVLLQFVIEAGTTGAIGGLIGILCGYLLSLAGSRVVSMLLDVSITISPSVNAVLTAFGISAAIGVLFGYLPARKAAYLNPIDALRYE